MRRNQVKRNQVKRKQAGRNKRKGCVLAAVILAAGMLSGCGGKEENTAQDSLAEVTEVTADWTATAPAAAVLETDTMFTDRDASGAYDVADAVEIQLGNESLTITEEGVYILSGSLEDGMVIVDGDESAKIQLVLINVEISNSKGAAIYVRQADKVFITLPEGTTNTLSGGDSYESLDDNNIDGIIFAKSDLTINGAGSLNITAATGHGIVSKDDLKVTGGSITVTAPGHGLQGKDSVRIGGGLTLHITAGKDGIHAENADTEDKGFVYIAEGSITIASEGDCISAGAYLQIDGGSFNLTAGKGSGEKTVARDEEGNEISTKGIKSSGQMILNGGSFSIDSGDDAVHSGSSLSVNGGSFEIATGDDGLHADETVTVAGGVVNISACYEGIEGQDVVISDGSIRLYATDDGINAAGSRNSTLLISGGTLYVNADGDGVDSNGDFKVTGGEIYISGPESNANGAIDYEGSAQITGGRLAALGASGMAMNFGDASTQGAAMINTSACKAGTEVRLEDEEGNVLINYTAESGFNSLVASCPEMVEGGSYVVYVGSEEYEITLENLIYGEGFGGFGGGMGGMPGNGGRGERPSMPGNRGNQGMPAPGDGELPEDGEMPPEFGDGELPEGEGMPPAFGDGELPEGEGMPPAFGDGERPEDGGMPQMPEDERMPGGGKTAPDAREL